MAEISFILEWWDYIAIVMILLVGLPHGALDAAIGMSIGFYDSNRNKSIFLISYLFFSFLIVVLWNFYPQTLLTIFLFISVFHFGLGDSKWNNKFSYYLSGYFNGGIIIFGLSYFNIYEVDSIYKILVGHNSDKVWYFLEKGVWLWLLLCPFHLYINWKYIDKTYLLILIFVIIIIYFLPPLLAFAIYFSLVHSFNHVKRIIPALKKKLSDRSILKLFLSFTFFSWLLGLIILLTLIQTNSITDAMLKLTFIGLAALTFPHMILVDFFFRPKLKV